MARCPPGLSSKEASPHYHNHCSQNHQGETSPRSMATSNRHKVKRSTFPLGSQAMRGTKGAAMTQHWQQRRTAAKDGALQLSTVQGCHAEREEAQPEQEGSCRHAMAVSGFNTCAELWHGPGVLDGGTGSLQDPQYMQRVPKSPHLTTGDTPQGGALPPHPCIPTPPGSQSPSRVPRSPGRRSAQPGFVLLSLQAVINSQRLAAATRGGRFCPPATLQRQGLICLEHTRSLFTGTLSSSTGKAKERLIYGSAFQSLPLPSRCSLGEAESPLIRGCPSGTD